MWGTAQTWTMFLLEKITLKQSSKGKVQKERNRKQQEGWLAIQRGIFHKKAVALIQSP